MKYWVIILTSPLEESSTFVPLSLKRRGGGNKERGANAPLKHPVNIGFQKEKGIKRKERLMPFLNSLRFLKKRKEGIVPDRRSR